MRAAGGGEVGGERGGGFVQGGAPIVEGVRLLRERAKVEALGGRRVRGTQGAVVRADQPWAAEARAERPVQERVRILRQQRGEVLILEDDRVDAALVAVAPDESVPFRGQNGVGIDDHLAVRDAVEFPENAPTEKLGPVLSGFAGLEPPEFDAGL